MRVRWWKRGRRQRETLLADCGCTKSRECGNLEFEAKYCRCEGCAGAIPSRGRPFGLFAPAQSAVIGSVVVGLARHNAGAEMSAKTMSAE
jgi:hypothetical protein